MRSSNVAPGPTGGLTREGTYRCIVLTFLDRRCYGRKVGGSTVCIKLDCTENHRAKEKETASEPMVYVMKNKDVVFSQLNVAASRLAPELLESWLTKPYPLSDWHVKYCSITGDDMEVVSKTSTEIREQELHSASYGTPRKSLKLGSGLAKPMDSITPYTRQFELSPGTKPTVEDVSQTLTTLESGIISTSTSLENVISQVHESSSKTEVILRENEASTAKLMAMIGNFPEQEVPFLTPTLWGTVAAVCDVLPKLMEDRKPSPVEVTREAFETMKAQASFEFQAIQNRFGEVSKNHR